MTRWILLISGVRGAASACGVGLWRRVLAPLDDWDGCRAAPRSRCPETDFKAKKRGPLQAVPVIARAIADRLE